jgi:hypothetical protein
VKNFQRKILDPFANSILEYLHVSDLFGGHVVRPLNTSSIVVVKRRGREGVRDVVATFADTIDQVQWEDKAIGQGAMCNAGEDY